MTIRTQVISGLRWTVGARLTAQLITWAITLLVIRILSPSDYGLLAMAMVFVAFLSMFSEFGLGSAIIQKTEVDEDTLKRTLAVIIAIHASLAALLALSAPLIAAFFTEGRLVPIVRVLSLQFVIAAFAVIPDALLQRRMAFRGRSLVDLSAAVVGAITTLCLALAGEGVWALIASSLLTQAWKTIGINLLAPFVRWPHFSLKGMRSLVRFGGHVTAAQGLWMFFTQVDALICGKFLGKDALGFYSVALHLASLPNQRIAGIINQIAFPAFSRIQHDVGKVGANLLLGVRLLSFFSFPVLWGISSIAPEIVEVILGPKWGPSALPLQLMGLVMPLRIINNFVPNATQGIGRSDILLKNAIFAAFIMPAAFLTGVHWGLLGLSIAWLVAVPIAFLQNMLRSLPVIGLNLHMLAKAMMPSTIACAAMYLAVIATRLTLTIELGGTLRLVLLVLAGAVTYLATSFWWNRAGIRETLHVIRSVATSGNDGSVAK
jgi:O-antigen/teichoic acid export membrane protein